MRIFYISGSFQVFQISTVLGLNLLGTITKFRSYRCNGNSTVAVRKKSVLISMCVVMLFSFIAAAWFIFYQMHGDKFAGYRINSDIKLIAEMLYYHLFEIIPTVSVNIIMLVFAYKYYINSPLNNYTVQPSSPKKQFLAIKKRFQINLIIFLSSWLPFIVFNVLYVLTRNGSMFFICYYFIIYTKLVMFALNPFSDGLWTTYCRRKVRLILLNSVCYKITQYCKEHNISKNKTKESHQASNLSVLTKEFPPKERPHIKLNKNANIEMAVVSFRNIFANTTVDPKTDEISNRLYARRGKQHMPMLQLRSVISKEFFKGLSPNRDKTSGLSSDKSLNGNCFKDFSGNMSPNPATSKHASCCSSPYLTLSRGSSITTPLFQMSCQQSFDISSDFEIPTCSTFDISPHPDKFYKSIDTLSSNESVFSMSPETSTYFSVKSVLSKLRSMSSRSDMSYVTLRSPLSEQVKFDSTRTEDVKSGAKRTELVESRAIGTKQVQCNSKRIMTILPLTAYPNSAKSTHSFTFSPPRELTHEMKSDVRGLKKMLLTLTPGPKSARPRSFTFPN